MSVHALVHCLVAVARHHGQGASTDALVDEHSLQSVAPNNAQMLAMARGLGLKARWRKLDFKALASQEGVFPLVARLQDSGACLVAGLVREGDDTRVAVIDPRTPGVRKLARAELDALWTGELLFLAPERESQDTEERFSIRWFLPEILRQSDAFRDIAIATFALGVVGLGLPVFTQ